MTRTAPFNLALATAALLVAVCLAQSPDPKLCFEELAKDCGKAKANQTLCHDCIKAKSKYITKCTIFEEIEFCEPAACSEALELLCSTERRNGTEAECDKCIKLHFLQLEKFQCDASDARAFCARPGPPTPKPPPSNECYHAVSCRDAVLPAPNGSRRLTPCVCTA